MGEDDKALEFKHAHITGQAMRDHWGPIVDRIAAETADWRDEWIYDLITENERLREAIWDAVAEIEMGRPMTASHILAVAYDPTALGETK